MIHFSTLCIGLLSVSYLAKHMNFSSKANIFQRAYLLLLHTYVKKLKISKNMQVHTFFCQKTQDFSDWNISQKFLFCLRYFELHDSFVPRWMATFSRKKKKKKEHERNWRNFCFLQMLNTMVIRSSKVYNTGKITGDGKAVQELNLRDA